MKLTLLFLLTIVKGLSFIGEHYFEAEIIKGEIKVGDIAKKDATSLLVQPAN